jgi:hypothetical protein
MYLLLCICVRFKVDLPCWHETCQEVTNLHLGMNYLTRLMTRSFLQEEWNSEGEVQINGDLVFTSQRLKAEKTLKE